jgi:orotidine-5'-phosphate decarboxylase
VNEPQSEANESALSTSPSPQSSHFADRLIERLRELGHPLCVGLDPHLGRIPPLFRRGSMSPADPECADSVRDFLFALLDRLPGRVAIVKPQIAFFEQLGWRGMQVLESVVARARELDLLVLLDAKRGDIGSTAEGYARSYLEPDSPVLADAITLNPYMGLDTLEPFAERAEEYGRGLFVLVKTSNPGSGDVQDREVAGGYVYEAVASSLGELASRLEGPGTGWSSLGVVVGATYPEQAERVRELLPRALFLVPGYGAQGGSAADAVRGFTQGPRCLEGGIVNSGRAILFPDDGVGSDAVEWEKAIDGRIDEAIAELGEAVTAE